jgi:2-polyprenyl-3-methyl-5-hydroxy-6-metoxy-1,4-benzoquinol methylase
MSSSIDQLISKLTASLQDGTFVKLSLGNYKGSDDQLQKIMVRPIDTKRGARLYFLYKAKTRDTAKNYDLAEGVGLIEKLLGEGFRTAHLFTTANDHQLDISAKGKTRLVTSKPTFQNVPERDHDRPKKRLVDASSFYLKALGVTTDQGVVRSSQQDKWQQINKFVEILDGLVERAALGRDKKLRLVDMGSGKGYLTFAAYDHLRNALGFEVEMTGIDDRGELITLCSEIAAAAGFAGLRFEQGRIETADIGEVDVLIALHACNTATDDALYKGIKAGAKVLIAAPCCHQELRPQLMPPAVLEPVMKHAVMLEREAETLTDGIRAMLLESLGYRTRIFEFVSVEHTPKNNMIAATLRADVKPDGSMVRKVDALMAFYGIRQQRFRSLLADTIERPTERDMHASL